MAKLCKVEKNKRGKRDIAKYGAKREALVEVLKNPETTQEERMQVLQKLRKIPMTASKNRYRNRCELTGRPRGYMRKFRLSRIMFRELALQGKLPGVTKASW